MHQAVNLVLAGPLAALTALGHLKRGVVNTEQEVCGPQLVLALHAAPASAHSFRIPHLVVCGEGVDAVRGRVLRAVADKV